MGVCKGTTEIQLGGNDGIKITIQQGDVIIIPAGVTHKNLGKEHVIICVGGYPEGKEFDQNYGQPGERPQADKNIAGVGIPNMDPAYGNQGALVAVWKKNSP